MAILPGQEHPLFGNKKDKLLGFVSDPSNRFVRMNDLTFVSFGVYGVNVLCIS